MSSDTYILTGHSGELERLRLQSRIWEPAGRRLLTAIGEGHGARALDVGCGAMGWLQLLSEWVGPDGQSSAPTSKTRCSRRPASSWPRRGSTT